MFRMNAPTSAAPDAPPRPATPRPVRSAATLIVLRDTPRGLEVLMLRRADKANDQNSGASVFPGGVIDANDRGLHLHCKGLDDAAASARLAVPEGGLDYYAAAVRECFEEAGVLFAGDAQDQPVALEHFAPDRLDAMRHAAEQGTDALIGLCNAQGWHLAVDRLTYFSHWLTPPGMPRRFDTRFFVAQMPAGQSVRPDGRETVEHMWLKPAEAVDPARGLKLMNVTRKLLQQLAQFGSAADCIAHARGLQRIPKVMPRLANGPEGIRPVNMEDAPYDEISRVDPDGEGLGRYALEAGLVMRLSPRILRVTADSGHSYFVGLPQGDCALIDPLPLDPAHIAALQAAAPGRVRRLLSTQSLTEDGTDALDALRATWSDASSAQPAPGDAIDLGGATLQVLHSKNGVQFLQVEDRTLLTGRDAATVPPDADLIQWIAPRQGFMQAWPATIPPA